MKRPDRPTLSEFLETASSHDAAWALETVMGLFNALIAVDPNQSWKHLVHDAAELIVGFLEAQAATVRLKEPQVGRIVSFGSHPFDWDLGGALLDFEDTISGEVIATLRPRAVEDLGSAIGKAVPVGAVLSVPFAIERFPEEEADIPGSIQIYFARPRTFSPLEIQLAEAMAGRVALVMARKHALDMDRARRKKEWLVENLFSRISVEKRVKMKDLFGIMVEELEDILRIQSCSLFTVAEDSRSAVLETAWPETGGYHTIGQVFALDEHPYLRAAVRQDLPLGDFSYERIYPSYILVKNPAKSRLMTEDLRKFAEVHGIHSFLYVPLRVGDRVRHLLVFDALDMRRFFSAEDIEILTFFGKELTQVLEIERLDDILHDFKNPAIAVAGFARRVRRMIEEGDPRKAEMLRYTDVVIREGMRLQEMAISLYPVTRPELLDLGEVARSRFAINAEAMVEQNISCSTLDDASCEEGVNVCVPRLALERVLDNLLNNASKALPPQNGALRLSVGRKTDTAWVEIANTGRIAPEEEARFASRDTHGRGLNIVQRFVHAMGGSVEVRVEEDRTTFRIRLPVAPPSCA
jgi:signal transduction histidine kinase